MFFSNLTMFRFPTSLDLSGLESGVAELPLKPVGALEMSSAGFVSPFGDGFADELVYRSGRFIWLTIGSEQKILPAAVVNDLLHKKIKAIEENEGRKLGGRSRKRLKEDLLHELLPRAFVKPMRMDLFLDTETGLASVNTSSRRQAESAISHLRHAIGSFPALPLNAETVPRSVLTGWIAASSDLPDGLFLGDEAVLMDPTDDGATVKVTRQELESEEITKHLDAGKQVSRIALTLNDHLSLTFGEDLVVRKLKFLDGALDTLSDEIEDWRAEMIARFALMTGTVDRLFKSLNTAMKFSEAENTPTKPDTAFNTGPLQNPEDLRQAGVEGAAARSAQRAGEESDPLYPAAVKAVHEENRASISYVQRVLKIGYNRAARLIEAMEAAGIVSAPEDNGERRVLQRETA